MSDLQRLSEIQTRLDRAVAVSNPALYGTRAERLNAYIVCVNDIPFLLSEVRALTERIAAQGDRIEAAKDILTTHFNQPRFVGTTTLDTVTHAIWELNGRPNE